MHSVNGTVAPGFESLVPAFAAALDECGNGGGAVAVRHRGMPVVDLWGGIARSAESTPWRDNTAAVVFSSTKALVAVLVARLVESGALSYSTRVVDIWPEYRPGGKANTTVSDVLAHRAGVLATTADLTVDDVVDWERMVGLLAAERAQWTPGTAHQYHSHTFGWLAGEIVRRVTGKSVGALLAEDIARPLAADLWIGTPTPQLGRIALIESETSELDAIANALARTPRRPEAGLRALTLGGALPARLVGDGIGFNDPRLHAAQLPGAGGVATARALATVMSATVTETEGVRLVGPEVIAAATVPVSSGRPRYGGAGPWATWGMGFGVDAAGDRYLSRSSFGHNGAGGQVAFADPEQQVGFAFLTNHMKDADDSRAAALIGALGPCLDRSG